MFTINIYLKFALIALCLIGGIALAVAFGFWYAFPVILIGIGLLVSYFLLGTIQSAAQLMQTQDMDAAEKRLAMTKFPNLLYVSNRAYYYLTKGSIAMFRKDTQAAEEYLNKADSFDLPTDNERAMIQLQLASIAIQRNKWPQAKLHYNKLKECKITEPALKEQIAQFDQAFKQRGQVKAAQRGGGGGRGGAMYQPGGKRRRPKMR